MGASLTEISSGDSRTLESVRRRSRRHGEDGEVRLGSTRKPPASERLPQTVVMASGCLGLISLPARARPDHARVLERPIRA